MSRIARRAVARLAPPVALIERSDCSWLTKATALNSQSRSAALDCGTTGVVGLPVGLPQAAIAETVAAAARITDTRPSARGAHDVSRPRRRRTRSTSKTTLGEIVRANEVG